MKYKYIEKQIEGAKELAEKYPHMQTHQDIYKEHVEVLEKAKAFDEVIKASQKEKTYEQFWSRCNINNFIGSGTYMQFLVRKTTHTTGEVFFDVTRAKENEEYIVVDAESKEEAKEKVENPKGLLKVVPSSFNNGPISRALKAGMYRKDSDL